MGRKGEPSTAIIEREYPHGVVIRIPGFGLGQHLNQLHASAERAGPYRTTGRLRGLADAVRFGFRTPEAAQEFRRAAEQLCGDLVEPS